jgi:hypothetical protein
MKPNNIYILFFFILKIIKINSISINYNQNNMMIRNLILKQYLRLTIPLSKRLSIYKEKLISLYYDLPSVYYKLSEEDQYIIENVIALL